MGPVIVLNKIDLLEPEAINAIIESVKLRIEDVPVFAISIETGEGIEALKELITVGKTYCLLGSSGVGKSPLMNSISGVPTMKTDAISAFSNHGKHVTTHRELRVLDSGGLLIDNPGMREIGLTDTSDASNRTFDKITELALECRFKDCSHTVETGCAVLAAID